MGPIEIGQVLLLALFSLGTPRVSIDTSPALGLGPEAGIGRRDPSDILRLGDSHVVLYTKITSQDLLYPAPYGGEIWWAASEDQGQSWVERGRVLGAGPKGHEDSRGVFDPTVARGPDGTPYLYYSGVGARFNPRFERQGRAEPTRLFVAKLDLDAGQQTIQATRIGSPLGNLLPSSAKQKGFDSLRVRPATALQRNGLTYLYYRGLAFRDGTNRSPLGLALASTPADPLRRAHEGRMVLPFDGNALLGLHGPGVFALLTSGNRGLWWAPDGEHFAPLDVRVSGVLTSAGLNRSEQDGRLDSGDELWGLHVAGTFPDPYLERFSLRIEGKWPDPLESTSPAPGGRRDPAWGADSSWMAQHVQSRADAASARPHYVLLGDDLSEAFGGHSRSSASAGQPIWDKLFAGRKAANLGIRGDTTANLIWRVDHGALPAGKLTAILVQIGANQLGERSATDIAAGVETLLWRLRARRPLARVVITSVPATPAMDPELRETAGELNRLLAQLARRPNVRHVDLDAAFAGRPDEMFDVDGVGLSTAGYGAWWLALEPILAEIEMFVPEGANEHLKRLDR